jgi:hypothetical protein
LFFSLVVPPATAQDDHSREKLVVRVVDYAAVSPATLRLAMLEAKAIFRKADADTEWLLCPVEQCEVRALLPQVVVKILPASMEGSKSRPHTMGIAIPNESVAFVFYDRIASSELARDFSLRVLLASVMCHEVAHVLGLEHSDRSIMRGRFSRRELEDAVIGRLTFGTLQATGLHRAIEGRTGQADNSRLRVQE